MTIILVPDDSREKRLIRTNSHPFTSIITKFTKAMLF